jgi:protein AroM
MAQRKIGFITIGQSPREDVVGEMRELLGAGIDIVERGALDGLSCEEIEALKPHKNDFPLITRLRDQSVVIVGRRKITPRIQERIGELEGEGAELSALLCTEEFRGLESKRMLLMPSAILFGAVKAILSKGKLGVVVPLEEQRRAALKKWQKTGCEVIVETVDPFQAISETTSLLKTFKGGNVDLVVLDCIAYGGEMKECVSRISGKPVLLPRSLLARYVAELVSL